MSCAAAAALTIWLAAAGPADLSGPGAAPPAVAQEPLFADIVRRAGRLKAEAESLRRDGRPAPAGFAPAIRDLSALDMQAHLVLRERGVDGDLKCILKGIAEDLPVKLSELQAASDQKSRDRALRDMAYLLNDNVEVLTAPPQPEV